MELTINVFSFRKRRNSTARPPGNGVPVNVVWKSPYDVVSPVIEIRDTAIAANANFCYIPQLGRYYWLTPSKYRDDNHCELRCTCDVLATYQPDLMGQSFFIELSESNYNANYPDSRVAKLPTVSTSVSSATLPVLSESPFMMYYLEVIGTAANGAFTDKFIVSPQVISEIAKKALNDNETVQKFQTVLEGVLGGAGYADVFNAFPEKLNGIWVGMLQGIAASGVPVETLATSLMSAATDLFNGLKEDIIEQYKKPWDCIVKIKGLACDVPTIFEGTNTPVMLGAVDIGVVGKLIYNCISTEQSVTVSIPWRYSDWRNTDQFTRVVVMLPSTQLISLPASLLYGQTSITFKYRINAASGDVVGYITAGSRYICDVGFNIGQDIAVAKKSDSTTATLMEAASMLPSAAAGIATGNAAGVANTVISKGGEILQLALSDVVSARGISSQACVTGTEMSVIVMSNSTQDPSTLTPIGRPCRQVLPLGSLSGYTRCRDASASLTATKEEIEEVNSWLNGGFYVE